jgi:hypothetical protein
MGFPMTAPCLMPLSGVIGRRNREMAGDDLSKLAQIRVRKKLNDHLVKYLKEFDASEYFDGVDEQDFAQTYYEQEILSELIDTVATCK